jgi:hypothetical protein
MFRLALLLLFVCNTAVADFPLTITPSGYYLTVVDSSGVPSLVKIENVTDLTSGSSPVPPTTPIPVPPLPKFDTAIVEAVKTWAKQVDDTDSCQAVSLVYHHILQAVEDGLISENLVWTITREATDKALSITSSGKDWSLFRNKVSEIIAEKTRKGELFNKEKIGQLMRSIHHGMELAADGSTALSPGKSVSIVISTNGVIDEFK